VKRHTVNQSFYRVGKCLARAVLHPRRSSL
jgi:hypothetical protein